MENLHRGAPRNTRLLANLNLKRLEANKFEVWISSELRPQFIERQVRAAKPTNLIFQLV